MQKSLKILKLTAFLAASSLVLGGCQAANQPFFGKKTNHFNTFNQSNGYYSSPYKRVKPRKNIFKSPFSKPKNQYGHAPFHHNQANQKPKKYKNFIHRLRKQKTPYFQVAAPIPGPFDQFQRWVETEPDYRLYPGDQLDVVVQSAPELSRTLTIGPDGRIIMPMLDPIMAAGRSVTQVQNALTSGLAKQLRDPRVAITPRAYAPQQIFIGGEVQQPGTYTLPGPIGAIESIFMAGGFGPGARSTRVAVLRRTPSGAMMLRAVNIQGGIRNIREYNDNIQLRRGDIIFVPKTNLAEVGAFTQAVRQTIPVDFNVSYTLGNFGGGGGDGVVPAITPVITP